MQIDEMSIKHSRLFRCTYTFIAFYLHQIQILILTHSMSFVKIVSSAMWKDEKTFSAAVYQSQVMSTNKSLSFLRVRRPWGRTGQLTSVAHTLTTPKTSETAKLSASTTTTHQGRWWWTQLIHYSWAVEPRWSVGESVKRRSGCASAKYYNKIKTVHWCVLSQYYCTLIRW